MAKLMNLVGRVFGRWTVLYRVENDSRRRAIWSCRCSCGKEAIVRGDHLRDGKSTSCGCLKSEKARESKAIYQREWREKNKEMVDLKRREYVEKNREKINERTRLRSKMPGSKYKDSQKKYAEKNREKRSIASRKWYRENRDRTKSNSIKKLYGLTRQEYDKLLEDCNNTCEICGALLIGDNKPCVDHCHESSKVRGILCKKCNFSLGLFNDNAQALQKAIEYLNKHSFD